MTSTRWPALVVVALVVVALVLVGRGGDHGADPVDGGTATTAPEDGSVVDPGRPAAAMATVAPADAARSTWYCPVGLAAGFLPGDADSGDAEADDVESGDAGSGDGDTADDEDATADDEDAAADDKDAAAEDGDDLLAPREVTEAIVDGTVLVLTNVAEESRSGTVTFMGADGPVTSEAIEVPAQARIQLDLADLVDTPGPVAALAELDGGGVAAAVSVHGPHGTSLATCASQPGASWYLPVASTTLDARAVVTLFNPFPDDAIVEIGLTDRTPPAGFEAFPVPGESVVSLELTDVITVRPVFSISVTARTGQVVAALVQQHDGTASAGHEGLVVLPGAPVPARTWSFPAGVWDDGQAESYVFFNPGTVDAQADVAVALDDPATNGAVQPFEVTVPAGGLALLGSGNEEWARVPAGVGHSVTVRVHNDQPIVAAQRQFVFGGDRPGVTLAMGAPEVATEWVVPVVSVLGASGSMSLLNPSPLTRSRAEGTAVAEGATQELVSVELAETARRVMRPDQVLTLTGRPGARVTASEAVVVGTVFAFDGAGRASLLALPVEGTTRTPDPITPG